MELTTQTVKDEGKANVVCQTTCDRHEPCIMGHTKQRVCMPYGYKHKKHLHSRVNSNMPMHHANIIRPTTRILFKCASWISYKYIYTTSTPFQPA